jgi:fumarate hydratase class I
MKTRRLEYPFTADQAAVLRAGDRVSLSGLIFTGRDRLHKHLFEGGDCPVPLANAAIYHCGPVMVKEKAEWRAAAAGPTTSIREEPYMARILREHGVRVVIGKGGMGPATVRACAEQGAVYLEAVGGAAQVLAACIVKVRGVHFLKEFGQAEALWELEVRDFPALVSIDAKGVNLHDDIEHASREAWTRLVLNGGGGRA